MARDVTSAEAPDSRLTRLCAAVAEVLEAHPEFGEQDRAILMLSGPEPDGHRHGGMVILGYGPDGDQQAALDLLEQTEALFKASGLDMTFVPVNPQNPGMQ